MWSLRIITGISVGALLLLVSVGGPMAQPPVVLSVGSPMTTQQSATVIGVGKQQVTVGTAPDAAPIGAIMPFAGALPDKVIVKLAQAGWLPCDGRPLSMDAFPELWENIGTTWGAQPAQRKFNLPDLRGRFLVGVPEPEKVQDAKAGKNIPVGATVGIEENVHTLKEWRSSGRCIKCKPWSADSAFQGKLEEQRFADKGHKHNVTLPPSSVVTFIIKVK